MKDIKTIGDINRLITHKVEESIHLDYKASGALVMNDERKKKDIAKDVSAFANSDGGRIIYGITEDKTYPLSIDPIDRTVITKEWLEQIIDSNISPKVNVEIIPIRVPSDPNKVIYVVNIEKGDTVHQLSNDGRYYKRRNFKSDVMAHYEIEDVMNRNKHPKIEISFIIDKECKRFFKGLKTKNIELPLTGNGTVSLPMAEYEYECKYFINVYAYNMGDVYAKYVQCSIDISKELLCDKDTNLIFSNKDSVILPNSETALRLGKIKIKDLIDTEKISWKVSADNSKIIKGDINIGDITVKQSNDSSFDSLF